MLKTGLFIYIGLIATLFFVLIASGSTAIPEFMEELPNDGTSFKCGNCHVSTNGGGELNAFGEDFRDAGYKYDNNLSADDSDGDGYSNKAEFNANPATNPGDPDSYPDPEHERSTIFATVIFAIVFLGVGIFMVWRK